MGVILTTYDTWDDPPSLWEKGSSLKHDLQAVAGISPPVTRPSKREEHFSWMSCCHISHQHEIHPLVHQVFSSQHEQNTDASELCCGLWFVGNRMYIYVCDIMYIYIYVKNYTHMVCDMERTPCHKIDNLSFIIQVFFSRICQNVISMFFFSTWLSGLVPSFRDLVALDRKISRLSFQLTNSRVRHKTDVENRLSA